jgi:hypothetical protein
MERINQSVVHLEKRLTSSEYNESMPHRRCWPTFGNPLG